MAKKKKDEAAFREVVQVNLLPEMEPQIVEYISDFEHVWASLQQALLTGYRATITYDEVYAVYAASLFAYDLASPNAGLMLYGNSESLIGALGCLMFKHEVLSSWGKWSGSEPKSKARFS